MDLFKKAKKLIAANEDKLEDAVEKIAGVVNDKTGGKYEDQVDKGADAALKLIDQADGDDEAEKADGGDSQPDG